MIIKNLEELIHLVKNARKNKYSIGAMSGGYDLLHEGHQLAINKSSNKVDKLFVLVNSDYSIRKYKGRSRPINKENIRINKLEKFNENNFYFLFDELIPNNILEIIKPDIYFVPPSWSNSPIELLVLSNFKTKIEVHPFIQGVSTTSISNNKISSGAIFLDRDGTINQDTGYIKDIFEVKISKENYEGLKKLSNLDIPMFIVTNQSGVSKNLLTKEEFKIVNNHIISLINENGGRIDKTYYDFSNNKKPSKYRKPNIGMVEQAIEDFDISLSNSWMIGDKDTDILLGKKCNMKTILIDNTQYEYKSIIKPEFVCKNLLEASDIIEKHI